MNVGQWIYLIFSFHSDPTFQGPIPNLDGCEGHSEHILFGSNVDITDLEPWEWDQPITFYLIN